MSSDDVCNILLSEFKDSFDGLSLADKCPACGIIGARHLRTEPGIISTSSDNSRYVSSEKNLLSATSQAFMKLKNHLPTFNVNTTECRTFLKQMI